MCANRFLEHPIFGMQFSHYRAHCQSFDISCRGRVFLAVVACRWRTDRREGRVNTINNLLKLELRGHSDKEVMDFLQRFQMGCSTLQPTDFKDPDQLYVWLYDKFKNWAPIRRSVERIKRSTNRTRYRRTWGYLMQAIVAYLTTKHHESNLQNYLDGLANKLNIRGGVARRRDDRRDDRQERSERGSRSSRNIPGGAATVEERGSKKKKKSKRSKTAPPSSRKPEDSKGNSKYFAAIARIDNAQVLTKNMVNDKAT